MWGNCQKAESTGWKSFWETTELQMPETIDYGFKHTINYLRAQGEAGMRWFVKLRHAKAAVYTLEAKSHMQDSTRCTLRRDLRRS